MRNVLITAQEVLFHAPTKQAVDMRPIEQSIIVAEERFIRPKLGYDLYESLCAEKNKVVVEADLAELKTKTGNPELKVGDLVNSFEFLSAPRQELWKQHLWKIVAECVMISAYPEGFVQFGAEGAFHNSPPAGLMVTSGLITPLLSSMKWAIDKKVNERLEPLLESMHLYICRNLSSFGNYIKACPDCNGNTGKSYTGGIALGLYDDDEDGRCCDDAGWR